MIARWTLLIFDVRVNETLIDQVCVQRVKTNKNGVHKYQVRRPFEFGYLSVNHKYTDGYVPLAAQVFEALRKEGYKILST
jgi:hypothetical protein